jgi:hypothetical protein
MSSLTCPKFGPRADIDFDNAKEQPHAKELILILIHLDTGP